MLPIQGGGARPQMMGPMPRSGGMNTPGGGAMNVKGGPVRIDSTGKVQGESQSSSVSSSHSSEINHLMSRQGGSGLKASHGGLPAFLMGGDDIGMMISKASPEKMDKKHSLAKQIFKGVLFAADLASEVMG